MVPPGPNSRRETPIWTWSIYILDSVACRDLSHKERGASSCLLDEEWKMRQGDTSRRRRFSTTRTRWYAEYRATRFSLRMLGESRNIYEAANITMSRIRYRRETKRLNTEQSSCPSIQTGVLTVTR